MRIADLLHRQFARGLSEIHAARARTVFAAACAVLRAGRLSLTSVGRSLAEKTTQKHGIKRMDRLLGNDALWSERIVVFRAIAERVIPSGTRPVVVVDWTSFSPSMWSLVAAVSFEGRAVIVYSETHPVSRYIKPAVHKRFLRRLSEVLPPSCLPIVVTDAGFRTPWMKQVVSLGWDYVCRLRGLNRLRGERSERWLPLRKFFSDINTKPKDFGYHEVGLRTQYVTRVIGYRKRQVVKRSRKAWSEKWGRLSRSRLNKNLRGAREPWLLATSLRTNPKKIVAHYTTRMQIEETFRDTKNVRFGLAMNQASTRNTRRADVLMLLATLAHLLSIVVGLIAEACRLDRGFQANTLRHRRVFSLSRLGRLVMTTDRTPIPITPAAFAAAWATFDDRLKNGLEPL